MCAYLFIFYCYCCALCDVGEYNCKDTRFGNIGNNFERVLLELRMIRLLVEEKCFLSEIFANNFIRIKNLSGFKKSLLTFQYHFKRQVFYFFPNIWKLSDALLRSISL